MNSLSVRLDIPRDLLGALDVPEREVEMRIKELIALELFREGRISSGKGAELIGVSKHVFIQLLAHHDIPYFTQSPEGLRDEVEALDHLLKSD